MYRHSNILAHLLVAVAGGRKAEGVLACGQILCGKIKLIAFCRTANCFLVAVLHLVPLEGYSAGALHIDKQRPRTAIGHAHLGGIVHALDGELRHGDIGRRFSFQLRRTQPDSVALLKVPALRQQVGQRQVKTAVDGQLADVAAALGIDDLRRTGTHRPAIDGAVAVQVNGVRTVRIESRTEIRVGIFQQYDGFAVLYFVDSSIPLCV